MPLSCRMVYRVAVRAGIDDLGRGLAGDGIVEFILHHGVKCVGDGGVLVVVDAAFGKDVGDLLPDAPFAGTDGAHPLQQFAEIVFAEGRLSLFEAVVVQDEAFGDVLLQHAGGPDAEMGGPAGVDPIPHRDDGYSQAALR